MRENNLSIIFESGNKLLPDEYNSSHLSILLSAIVTAYVVMSLPFYKPNVPYLTPALRHAIDPTYLSNDWTVAFRTEFASPRYFYVESIAAVAQQIGLQPTLFALYFVTTVLILVYSWLFVDELFNDRLVATVTLGFLLLHYVSSPWIGVFYPPGLGSNSLLDSFPKPFHVANALILPALVYTLRERYRLGFLLFGLATVVHVVNGFWIALVAGICAVVTEAGGDLRKRRLWAAVRSIPWDGALVYAVVSGIVIFPLLVSNLSSTTSGEAAMINIWRHPAHFIPTAWPSAITVLTVVFITLALLMLFKFDYILIEDSRKRAFVYTYVGAIISIMMLVGYVFTFIIPISPMIMLQGFRIDDFLYIPLYGILAKSILICLFYLSGSVSMNREVVVVGVICAVVIAGTAGWIGVFVVSTQYDVGYTPSNYDSNNILENYVSSSSGNFGGLTQNQTDAYDWIEQNTPRDAVFIIPPTQEDFRMKASRAVVVSWTIPKDSEAMVEWDRRMTEVCNTDTSQYRSGNTRFERDCSNNFHNLTENQVMNLSKAYNANWILTKNDSYTFTEETTVGEYHIYKIGDQREASRSSPLIHAGA